MTTKKRSNRADGRGQLRNDHNSSNPRRSVAQSEAVIRKKKIERIVIIAVVLLLTVFVFNWMKSFIIARTVDFERTKIGSIDYVYDTKGLLIYKEELLVAPADGRFEPSVGEWVMVKKDAKIGTFVARATDGKSDEVKMKILTPNTGIVSYQIDGLEGKLDPLDIGAIDEEMLKTYMASAKIDTTIMEKVESGNTVAKIIDSKVNPLLFFTVEKGVFEVVPKLNDKIEVAMSSNIRLMGTVKQILAKGSNYEILLSFNKPIDDVYCKRISDVKVKLDTYKGTIVKTSAIVPDGDKHYVYYSYKGVASKKEVDVVGVVNDEAVVRGLDEGVYYITNPRFIKEGQILK